MSNKVVTRFAPSPTGHLHIGGARTAIFSWLLARHFGGEFLLRIEDTDLERSKQEYTDSILSSMRWLGLDWDRDLVYQTQRSERYNEVIETMLANGSAYHCTCTIEEIEQMRAEAEAKGEKPCYNGKCRDLNIQETENSVVRLKVPNSGNVIFEDLVKGFINTDIKELDDMVLRRPKASGGMPTYNLAVVADDYDMGVTHALRGDDHVANTPKQILIYNALGWQTPVFGHVPMILAPDGQKLSKRNGARAVIEYQADGLLPEAIVNYLVRLGWSNGDNEIFLLEDLVQLFDGSSLNASASRIDPAKLDWLNAHYMKQKSADELLESLKELSNITGENLTQDASKLILLFRDRASNLVELTKQMNDFSNNVLNTELPVYEEKAQKSIQDESKALLAKILERFKLISAFTTEEIDACIHNFVEEEGIKFKNIGPALRCALTGQGGGPSLASIAFLLGKEKCISRIEAIIK